MGVDVDEAELDEIVRAHLGRDFPSAVCLVFDRGGTRYRRAFGGADADNWFDLASVSKLFTFTILFAVMGEGGLTPEDRLLPLLPADRLGPVTAARLTDVTLEQLLTHTSGIVPWFPFYTDGRDFYTVLERVLSETPAQAGTAYSDLNFMLLGEVVSCLSGLSLPQALERYIKEPLGIRDLAYGPIDPALAVPSSLGNQIEREMCAERGLSFGGFRPDGPALRGEANDGNCFYFFGGAAGHAGVFGTADALATLGRFYLNTKHPLLRRAMETDVGERGLGFDRGNPYRPGCGHSGFTGTSLWLSPARDVGAVLLTNRLYFSDGRRPLLTDFRRAFHDCLRRSCQSVPKLRRNFT